MGCDYFSLPRPRLFGHRGAAGVAPENTMASFRRALADGARYLELDVHGSGDGIVVVIHDPTVDRTTEGTGAVHSLPFSRLSRLDAGFRFATGEQFPFRGAGVTIPALHELLEEFPETPLNVEIKQGEPPIEPAVVKLLERYDAFGRVMLAAESHDIMMRIRSLAPHASTSLSAVEVREFFERCFAGTLAGYRAPGRALQIPPRFEDLDLVSEEALAAIHHHGLEVHLWTINEPSDAEHYLALGVDGLMSDFPDRLVRAAGKVRPPVPVVPTPTAGRSAADRPEDRTQPRSPLGAMGTLRFPDGSPHPGLFSDISFGGVRVEVRYGGNPARLVGKTIAMEIPALDDAGPTRLGTLTAKVVRAEPGTPGQVVLGLEFAGSVVGKLRAVLSHFRPEPG